MNRKKLALLSVLVLLIVAFFALDLKRFLTLESLKANQVALARLHADHQIAFVAAFIAIYVIQTALSLPGAAILSLAAGAIFGSIMGTVYAVTGASIGAILAFILTRYLFRDTVAKKFGGRLQGLNTELEKSGLNYLLFLRLVPIFPFFLINLGAALTAMPLRTFTIGTFFGIIPGGFVYCNAGASLATIHSMSDIASLRVLGSFALLGLFALVPALYKKIKGPGAGDK
ncbi:MAG: TVP38/TMEM64 family protein [Geobacter sp.]|nr:TVP38/TMEM64 family protein [Geobacter sp.]